MNRIELTGKIVKDPVAFEGATCDSVNFTVLTPPEPGDKYGTYVNCVAFDPVGKLDGIVTMIKKNFTDGTEVHVAGVLKANNYTDKNGVKHYGYKVVVDAAESDIVVYGFTREQSTHPAYGRR